VWWEFVRDSSRRYGHLDVSKLIALVFAAAIVFTGVGCSGCATALLEGVLVADGAGGLAVQGDSGTITPVTWPGDAHVTKDGERLALANTLGFVFAHEGEFVSMGGGVPGDGPTFAACGPIAVRASGSPAR
jgi:hypothetical protein